MMGSRRIHPLPNDWHKIKKEVFARDGYQCVQIRQDGNRCYNTEQLECDHIGDPTVHELYNLQTLCKGHHAAKTGSQAGQMSVLSRKGRFLTE